MSGIIHLIRISNKGLPYLSTCTSNTAKNILYSETGITSSKLGYTAANQYEMLHRCGTFDCVDRLNAIEAII